MLLRILGSLAIMAGMASQCLGAGVMVLRLVPDNATVSPGGEVTVRVYADREGIPGAQMLSGFKFDVLGHGGGTLTGVVNSTDFPQGLSNGVPSGADLIDFSAGQLPTDFGGVYTGNYLGRLMFRDTTNVGGYTVQLGVTDLYAPTGALNAYLSGNGIQSRSHITLNTGNFHTVTVVSTPFTVIPSPGASAIIGMGLLATRRRR